MSPPLGILFALLVGFIGTLRYRTISIRQRLPLLPRPARFVLSFYSPVIFLKSRRAIFTL